MSQNEPINFLDLPAQHAALKDALTERFVDHLSRAAFVGGPAVESFEKAFAKFCDCEHAIGVSSGTDALVLALIAIGAGPGSRVITTPNTFIATTEAISRVGADICFVDADEATSLMDVGQLEELLKAEFANGPTGDRPDVIMPVHLYGQCVDMDPLLALAKKYQLKVIEDAAQAHGATYKGRLAGSMGDAAGFSFYPGKNLGACGDGGAVTTNSGDIAEKIRMLKDHGQRVKNRHDLHLGGTYRLDAMQAAFLGVKLPHLANWNARRRQIAARYDAAFADVDGVTTVANRDDGDSVYHLYVIHVQNRDGLAAFLQEHKIYTGQHYPVALHLQPCYADMNLPEGRFPVSEKLAAELISLPIFAELNDDQVDRVIASVKEFVAQ